MSEKEDPIQRAQSGDIDLYDIVHWEPRSALDRLATAVYGGIAASLRAIVVLLALLILASQFLLSGIAAIQSPMIGLYILLSVVPALLLAVYVWKVDVTMREPLELLVGTFVLGVLFAGFAAIVNSSFKGFFVAFGGLGLVLFFYLVVAPIEETVKWLAVRLFAYRSSEFNAVIDGAVYGAMAGLGFATIENTIYIAQPYLNAAGVEAGLNEALQTAAVRTLAGPGHVIYSAFAGYYLGLAKFNRGRRGPIVVKGLLIAAFIHATYNAIVTNLGAVTAFLPVPAVSEGLVFIAFIAVYDGVFFYALYRKLSAYRNAFVASGASNEFDDDVGDDPPAPAEVSVSEDRDPLTGDAEAVDPLDIGDDDAVDRDQPAPDPDGGHSAPSDRSTTSHDTTRTASEDQAVEDLAAEDRADDGGFSFGHERRADDADRD